MNSDTIVDLCDAVSELAAERNEYRRKAESQAARHSDEVEALRAERDEARCSMFDAATDRDDANHAADKARWDAEQLRRELAAMQAERTELADLRAKLALQQQIAIDATKQRDEQTARLAEAQAEIARLRAERSCKQCGKQLDTWCEQCDVPNEDEPTDCVLPLTEANAEKLWRAMREFPIAHEWDDVSPFTHDAFTRTIVTRVNQKPSKPTVVDVADLAREIRYNATSQPLELTRHQHAYRLAWWIVRTLKLEGDGDPIAPQTGEVQS